MTKEWIKKKNQFDVVDVRAGTFASKIGPSSLFGDYQLIKTLENKGKIREEVVGELMDNFGEKKPEVNVMPT